MLHVNMSCPSVLHDRNPCNLNVVLTIDGTVLTYKTFARVLNKIIILGTVNGNSCYATKCFSSENVMKILHRSTFRPRYFYVRLSLKFIGTKVALMSAVQE